MVDVMTWQRRTSGKSKRVKTKSPSEWLSEVQEELYESVLPFWMSHSYDNVLGGFVSCVGRDGTPYGTDKYTWLNGRAVWMTAEIARHKSEAEIHSLSGGRLSRNSLLGASIKTADFLLRHAVRPDGQLWFCLTGDGLPVHLERKPFSAMFTCQGLGCLAEVLSQDSSTSSQAEKYANEARAMLDQILSWAHDPTPLGRPSCAGATLTPWNVPMIALSLLETMRPILTDKAAHYEAEGAIYDDLIFFFPPT